MFVFGFVFAGAKLQKNSESSITAADSLLPIRQPGSAARSAATDPTAEKSGPPCHKMHDNGCFFVLFSYI